MAKKYLKSDRILTVDNTDFSQEEFNVLLHSGKKAENRKKASQDLLDYLCDFYGIPHCKVRVVDQMRPTRRGRELWGIYYGALMSITIWNNIDFRKPCDIRTFINTLLHEFMHHYDFQYLKLSNSTHGKGFDARIRDLRKKLSGVAA